jgi:hypothetical protein
LPNDGLQLVDKHGNETVFDPGWKFNKMLPSRDQRMVRLLSMGNQTVEFRYAIDRSGKLVIASASLASPQAPSRHVVRYEHDAEGRLCRVQHSEIPKSQDHRNQGSDLAMAEKSGLPFVRIGHPQ